ncbi:MAG: hypothetical protein H7A09_01250 [Oceanospirillaceae bacterium]|nr:hypothetical protein [Oceanospirillaceae bacterium]
MLSKNTPEKLTERKKKIHTKLANSIFKPSNNPYKINTKILKMEILMLNKIAKLLSSESKQPTRRTLNEAIEQAVSNFKNDYIINKELVEKFNPDMREKIIEHIDEIYNSSIKEENSFDPSFLFLGIKILYLSLWLEETGYGKILALKMSQLIYKDDYGDLCI